MFPHLRPISIQSAKVDAVVYLAVNCVINDRKFIKVTWWTWSMSLVITVIFCAGLLGTCSMPGLSGLRSGLVSTFSGMSLQPTRGISSQCLRTVRAKCSSVCFFRPVNQTKLTSFHIWSEKTYILYKLSKFLTTLILNFCWPKKIRFATLTLPHQVHSGVHPIYLLCTI